MFQVKKDFNDNRMMKNSKLHYPQERNYRKTIYPSNIADAIHGIKFINKQIKKDDDFRNVSLLYDFYLFSSLNTSCMSFY